MDPKRNRPGVKRRAHPEAHDLEGRVNSTQNAEPSTSEGEKPSQADLLVELGRERYRFGRTLDRELFAVPREGPKVALMLRGHAQSLRAELARTFSRDFGKTPNATAISSAMLVLEGEAQSAEPEKTFLRLARHRGAIYLDLGDATGHCVCVNADGWQMQSASPVLFRRTELTGAMPEPARGGDVAELRTMLNVTESSWPLLLGWVVSTLIPEIPHPIALLGGIQGAGKSTAAAMIGSLLDPSPAPLRSAPGDLEQWVLSASGSWLVCLDNASRIPEWLSDALCRAVTGDALVRRRLYTDTALSVVTFRRVVLITSIDVGALRGDLGDRLVLFDLEPIQAQHRREDRELWQTFKEARARVLGGVLDLLVRLLRVMPTVKLPEKSRMADFHRVLAALDHVLGTSALDAYLEQRGRVAWEVVESDPLAQAIVDLISEEGEFQGTATELLRRLEPLKPPRDWPRSPRALSGRLRRLTPALRECGVDVQAPSESRRESTRERRRVFVLRQVEEGRSDTVQTAQPSATDGAAPDCDSGGKPPPVDVDDADGVDGCSPPFSVHSDAASDSHPDADAEAAAEREAIQGEDCGAVEQRPDSDDSGLDGDEEIPF